jgi:hypothetical protein
MREWLGGQLGRVLSESNLQATPHCTRGRSGIGTRSGSDRVRLVYKYRPKNTSALVSGETRSLPLPVLIPLRGLVDHTFFASQATQFANEQ